jgi:tRNA (mo5U34)-methyltransferase
VDEHAVVESEPAETALRRRVVELGPWFHQIDLGSGILTRDVAPAPGPEARENPRQRWLDLEAALREDLAGRRVLDAGCLDGYFSIRLLERGAAEVVALDIWTSALDRLTLAKETLGLERITPVLGSIYDLDPATDGRFDVVVMIDVLYALAHPLLALERLASVTDRLYVSSTVIRDRARSYLELRQSSGTHGTRSRYWVPTEACFEAMLEAAGFDDLTAAPTIDPNHLIYRAFRTSA